MCIKFGIWYVVLGPKIEYQIWYLVYYVSRMYALFLIGYLQLSEQLAATCYIIVWTDCLSTDSNKSLLMVNRCTVQALMCSNSLLLYTNKSNKMLSKMGKITQYV